MDHLLTLLLLLPLIGAIAVLCMRTESTGRWVALGTTLGTFALSLVAIIFFDTHHGKSYGYDGGTMQLVEQSDGIAPLHLHYKVGVDGLSLPLIVLTTFIMVIACVSSWNISKMSRVFLALLLLFESACLGVFLSLNLIQFYAFFEFALLPVYLLSGIWGGPEKRSTLIRFFCCMTVGSIALLAAIISIHHHAGSFDMILLAQPALQKKLAIVLGGVSGTAAETLFLLLLLSFLIKLRAVPFHGWLTKLHIETPTPVGLMVSALLPAMGGYGILRIAFPLFPQAAKMLWMFVAVLGVAGLIYTGLCALAQTDPKRLIEYATINRAGLVLVGIATMTPAGINGALFMIIANAVTAAMLCVIASILRNRDGGSVAATPKAAGLGMLALFANAGLPGLCGFVGELLVLTGIFQAHRGDSVLHKLAVATGSTAHFTTTAWIIAAIACCNVVLTTAYTLRAARRTFLRASPSEKAPVNDLDSRELAVLIPLAVATVLLGLLPTVLVFSLSGMTIAAILKLF